MIDSNLGTITVNRATDAMITGTVRNFYSETSKPNEVVTSTMTEKSITSASESRSGGMTKSSAELSSYLSNNLSDLIVTKHTKPMLETTNDVSNISVQTTIGMYEFVIEY